MRRPGGVIVAAIVLGMIALLGIFGEVLVLGVSLFVGTPGIPNFQAARAMLVAMNCVALAFFLFCGWTVVGLFRMRRWARMSILVVGGVVFCLCAVLAVGMVLLRNSAPPLASPTAVSMHAIFLGMAVFYGLVALIGAWWLVYFNVAGVRAAFAAADPRLGDGQGYGEGQAQGSAVTGWRMVIVVWAWLLLVSAGFFPWAIWAHMPIFVFGAILRGAAAVGVVLVYVAVQAFVGVGLLRKWKAAWYAAMLWQAYSIAYFVAMLVPGTWRRFTAYQREIAGQWHLTVTSPQATQMIDQGPFMMLAFGVGAVIFLVLTWALIRRREDFLEAPSIAV